MSLLKSIKSMLEGKSGESAKFPAKESAKPATGHPAVQPEPKAKYVYPVDPDCPWVQGYMQYTIDKKLQEGPSRTQHDILRSVLVDAKVYELHRTVYECQRCQEYGEKNKVFLTSAIFPASSSFVLT